MEQGLDTVICDWNKPIDQDFLLAAEELTIFLKDGWSFFSANAKNLMARFSCPSKKTRIIIVHPDSPHMAAIAAKDPEKAHAPEIQRNDCLRAVKKLQEIREELLAAGKGDCAKRTLFIGQDLDPPWNGFIGDTEIVRNLYDARPHKGMLVSLRAQKGSMLYETALMDCHTFERRAVEEPHRNLWNYKLQNG